MKLKNIVTIGGGTGSFTLLTGLKKYPINISAIVSMADDGGSTGILRDELGVLPPGDVRQCLVALSESSEILRKLLNYRFESGGLKGHSFGNLFLSALEKVSGNFSSAVEEAIKILKVRGEVIPVTNQDIQLCMQLKNGKILKGQSQIEDNFDIEKIGIKKNWISPLAGANKKAIKKILEADLIIIGPGNFYSSIVPNFLVKGISEAIMKSKAKVIYNCNLVNKKGHTENFVLEDYITAINKLIGKNRIDFAIFNTKKPDVKLIKKYKNQRELLVKITNPKNIDKNYKIVRVDILSDEKPIYSKSDMIARTRSFIRHDGEKLAKAIIKILTK